MHSNKALKIKCAFSKVILIVSHSMYKSSELQRYLTSIYWNYKRHVCVICNFLENFTFELCCIVHASLMKKITEKCLRNHLHRIKILEINLLQIVFCGIFILFFLFFTVGILFITFSTRVTIHYRCTMQLCS